MESTTPPQEIHSILEQQHEIAQKLLRLLAAEFIALSGNDLQGIETNVAAKQHLIEQLEDLTGMLLMTKSQYASANNGSIERFLRDHDPHGLWGLVPLWLQIDALLSQCRQKNSTNGKIISLNHRHIQQALEILRHGGQDPQACYSSTGNRQSTASSRILGKV